MQIEEAIYVPVQGVAILQESDIATVIQLWRENAMFGAYERVDELLGVQRPEDWSLLGDEGKNRQQCPKHWRACCRKLRRDPASAFERQIHRRWFAYLPYQRPIGN